MSVKTEGLLAERARAWEAQKAVLAKSEWTAEDRAEMDRQDADIARLTEDIDRLIRADKMGAEFAAVDAGKRIEPTVDGGSREVEATEAEKRYDAAFGRFLREGVSNLRADDAALLLEKRLTPQATTSNAAGGYLVPQGYMLKITERLKAFGGLMSNTNIITTATGQALPWPSNDDTANAGALLSEGTAVTEVDLTVGTNELFVWTYTSGLVLVSLQLLQDSAFDLDTWLPGKLGTRLGRAIATDLVTGSGSSKPLGITNAPTSGVTGTTAKITAALWAAQVLTTAGNAYDNLVDLTHSVDPAYRQLGNCKFLMADLTLAAIRKVKDVEGRPIWQPQYPGGFANAGAGNSGNGVGDTILSLPVIVDNAVPVFAASATPILFGDFEAGYVTRNVLDPTIMRLAERYAEFLQVGFFGFQRIDGRPDDANAVRALTVAAS